LHLQTSAVPPLYGDTAADALGRGTRSQVWRTHSGECVHTFDKHTDYVQALAVAPAAHRFASVGLGGEVLLWDLTESNQPVAGGREPPLVAEGHKESVYSVAIDPHATMLVSAGTEYGIRVWDPRSGEKKCKLKVCTFHGPA
jgi:WD40 repeat protein